MPAPSQRLVEDLARDVVAQVSPAELPLFRSTATRYFADPGATLAPRGRADDPLGFGADAAVLLVAPFALELARTVLTRFLERLGDGVADGAAARALRWLKADDRAGSAGDEPARLDPAQLALVRRTAHEEARRLVLPEADASRLADALVAALATRGAAPTTG